MTQDTDLTQYRVLLTEAIQECETTKRPARAAWLMHYIRRGIPSFKLSDLGFANFRQLLMALGGFTVTHDGYGLRSENAARPFPADRVADHRIVRDAMRQLMLFWQPSLGG